jgi:ESF2/ABP1 family protein
VREQRMRTEISQAKRENSHYLASVEKGKEIEAIVERKRKRGATEDEVRTCSYSFLS